MIPTVLAQFWPLGHKDSPRDAKTAQNFFSTFKKGYFICPSVPGIIFDLKVLVIVSFCLKSWDRGAVPAPSQDTSRCPRTTNLTHKGALMKKL